MSVITGQGVTAYPLPDEELSPTSKNAVSNEAVCEGLGELKNTLNYMENLLFAGNASANTQLWDNTKVNQSDKIYYKFTATASTGYVEIYDTSDTRVAYFGKTSPSSTQTDFEGYYAIPANFAYAKVDNGGSINAAYFTIGKPIKDRVTTLETTYAGHTTEINKNSAILNEIGYLFSGGAVATQRLFDNTQISTGDTLYYKFTATGSTGYVEIYNTSNTRVAYFGKTSAGVVKTEYEGTYTIPANFGYARVDAGGTITADYFTVGEPIHVTVGVDGAKIGEISNENIQTSKNLVQLTNAVIESNQPTKLFAEYIGNGKVHIYSTEAISWAEIRIHFPITTLNNYYLSCKIYSGTTGVLECRFSGDAGNQTSTHPALSFDTLTPGTVRYFRSTVDWTLPSNGLYFAFSKGTAASIDIVIGDIMLCESTDVEPYEPRLLMQDYIIRTNVAKYPLTTMPVYIKNLLAYRPMGSLKKPYVCLTCDDGSEELATYTIPMLLEKGVPCTFSLWASGTPSEVLSDPTYRAIVLNAISTGGCDVAQHGGGSWANGTQADTSFDERTLNEFFDKEYAAFSTYGITPHGAVYPYGYVDSLSKSIVGGRFEVARSISGYTEDIYNNGCVAGDKSNLFALPSINIKSGVLQDWKDKLDYAIANNMLFIPYWHDFDLDAQAKTNLEGIIDYAKAQNVDFCVLADIPTLE